MRFIRVIDIETTGEDPAVDQVIEVGWVDVFADGTMMAPQGFMVRPTVPIGVEARAVHHITANDLAGGVTQGQIEALVMSGGPAAFVAHNAKFEQSFMPFISTAWICTYKCALRLWPDAPRHFNQVLRYWLDLSLEDELAMPPHRAQPDAYVTAHIFQNMLAQEGENRLRRLITWSKEPGLLPSIRFGKHKGKRWHEPPADYLEWIVDKSDMDEDVKFTATTELVRRQFPAQPTE